MPKLALGLLDVNPSKPAEKPEIMPKATLSQKMVLKINLIQGNLLMKIYMHCQKIK